MLCGTKEKFKNETDDLRKIFIYNLSQEANVFASLKLWSVKRDTVQLNSYLNDYQISFSLSIQPYNVGKYRNPHHIICSQFATVKK